MKSLQSRKKWSGKPGRNITGDVQKLKDLYTKHDEAKRKALLDAIEKSNNRSYEEIMAFLTAE